MATSRSTKPTRPTTRGKLVRGPWLQRNRPHTDIWTQVLWRDGSYVNLRFWLCVAGLRFWFDVPVNAKEVRLVVRRGVGAGGGDGKEYRVLDNVPDDEYMRLKTKYGSEYVSVYCAVRHFVQKGDWLGLEWRA